MSQLERRTNQISMMQDVTKGHEESKNFIDGLTFLRIKGGMSVDYNEFE